MFWCDYHPPEPPDATYKDPMGALPPRPKTGMAKQYKEDDFYGEELGDDLLPE